MPHYTINGLHCNYAKCKIFAPPGQCRRGFNQFLAEKDGNIFVRQSLREGRSPFEISLNRPSRATIAAMQEAERIARDPSAKGCADLDELFADLSPEAAKA